MIMSKTCVILIYVHEIRSLSTLTAGYPDEVEVYNQTPACGEPFESYDIGEAFPRLLTGHPGLVSPSCFSLRYA